ncbi:MAG: TerD family protein, partial [Solirubrobacteraceae bacterium]|nr:TerD family protein [Solirubrobacteraceae bacterium]
MTVALTPGANAALPAAQTVEVGLRAHTGHADLIVLLLDAGGKADGDNGVVLFSQPVSAGGAVSLDLASDTVTIKPGSLPEAVDRVLVVAQADGTPDVAGCGVLTASVVADGAAVATAAFDALPAVATLQLVELYRRAGAWKVRALGDGYADGLAKLLTVHGVEVTDEPTPASSAPAPASPAPASTPASASASAPDDAGLPSSVDMRKASGKVDLKKGQGPVLMEKTALITARVSWKSGTDYDVYALVLMRDGTAVDVAAFAAEGVPIRMEHAGVKHRGDVQAIPGAEEQEEILEIRLTPEVLAVVPVAYSAITNGGGSFKEYKVSLAIDNGAGTQITIPSQNASDHAAIFTCV